MHTDFEGRIAAAPSRAFSERLRLRVAGTSPAMTFFIQ
jgi:hypothetical protein